MSNATKSTLKVCSAFVLSDTVDAGGLRAKPNAHAGAATKNSSIANPNDGSPYADPAIANLTPIVPGQDFAGHKRGR